MQIIPRYLFSGLVAVFAVACLYEMRGDLAQLSLAPLLRSWDLVALAALCSLLNYAFRVIRWQNYLARLGRRLPLGFIGLTYVAGFAFTVSPGKVGEMARARYYSRLGISLPDVAGAFFLERLMDVIAMLVLAALIAAAAPRYHAAMWSAGVMVVATLVCLSLTPWDVIARWLEASPRLPRALARFGGGTAQALGAARSLLSPNALLLGFALGLAAWGLEGVGFYLLGSMFPNAHLTVTLGAGIYAVAVLVGAISFLPGGLGSTEAVMAALLTAQGFTVADALLVTIVCRLVTLWLAVLIGWVAVFALRNRLHPAVSSWP
jgi:glycosyltransferase 2 family protein